jgi:hypothetical protein
MQGVIAIQYCGFTVGTACHGLPHHCIIPADSSAFPITPLLIFKLRFEAHPNATSVFETGPLSLALITVFVTHVLHTAQAASRSWRAYMRVNACSASNSSNMKTATCLPSRLKKLPLPKVSFLLVPPHPLLQVISSTFPFLPKASRL